MRDSDQVVVVSTKSSHEPPKASIWSSWVSRVVTGHHFLTPHKMLLYDQASQNVSAEEALLTVFPWGGSVFPHETAGLFDMYADPPDMLVEDMWSVSPTGSDAYDPYCRVDFKSTDWSILSDSLQRLDRNTRKLKAELSHHTDLVETLASNVETVFGSELTESLNGIRRYATKVEDEIGLIVHQVDLERNERSVQQRMITSLRATLAEADRQLEQAAAFERQLHVIQAAHRLDQNRSTHAFPRDRESTDIGCASKVTDNIKSVDDKLSVDEGSSFSNWSVSPSLTGSTSRIESTVTKKKKSPMRDDHLSHQLFTGQTRSPDFEKDTHSRVSSSSQTRNRYTASSLDRVQRLGDQRTPLDHEKTRSRSADSSYPNSGPSAPNDAKEANTVLQSWFVQRIQLEMRRRHRTEALLAQTQRELEHLRSTDLIRTQDKTAEKLKNPNDHFASDRQNAVDHHKLHTVQKYLFDSVHCTQLPVLECSHSCSIHTSQKPEINSQTVPLESFTSSDTPLPNQSPFSGETRSGQSGHWDPFALQCSSVCYDKQPFRRHFSEPDLVISCRSSSSPSKNVTDLSYSSSVHNDSSPLVRFPSPSCQTSKSKPHLHIMPFASTQRSLGRPHKRQRTNSDHEKSISFRVNSTGAMHQLIAFLRNSNNLLFQLMQVYRFAHHADHRTKQLELQKFMHQYGEEFERFRSCILRANNPKTDLSNHEDSSLFPIYLCQLVQLYPTTERIPRLKAEDLDNPSSLFKRYRFHSSLEQLNSTACSDPDNHFTSHVWHEIDTPLLSSEDCSLQGTIVETLVTRLNRVSEKLRAQMEQCNELEALLAERDARLVAQNSELAEAEAHLAASTETVASLHKKILAGSRNWTQLLENIQHRTGSSSDPSSLRVGPDQLPALPAVLDLVRSLDAAYAELQESERCRILAEQRATSALNTARRLRGQLRDNLIQPLDSGMFAPDLTDLCYVTPQLDKSSQTEEVTPPSLLSKNTPERVLCDVAVQHSDSATEKGPTLQDEVDRLQKYRITQKTRYEQLQQRFFQLNSELDATVDVLRHHQTSSEVERRRTAVELSQLRTQLAKANSLLDHYRMIQTKSTAPLATVSSKDRGLAALRGMMMILITFTFDAVRMDATKLK
ncbi:unnamed protein product [Echinostoma caproni]|uniref:ANK_REP_REGION domain-containing protein n=1 Tax=Echinostoma caproni TaxID=27848 RepID=A0A183ATJ7_9TREM|nr:unnamed protein product [Echinostoma caproni]